MPHDKKFDLTGRRFRAGDTYAVAGFKFRVEVGKKTEIGGRPVTGDLRLDLYDSGSGRWVAVPMSMLCLMFDFLWENEHNLYPPSLGYRGGEKLTDALHRARNHGWEAATQYLDSEKRAAASRGHQQSLFSGRRAS